MVPEASLERVTADVGYSGTPLPTKLGIVADRRVLVLGAPVGFLDTTLGAVPGATVHVRAGSTPYDVVLAFATSARVLTTRLDAGRRRLTTPGAIWLMWPKKSSGVSTDLSESVVREMGLATGLVDVKVAAIDVTWSGLKFTTRVRDR